MIHNAEFLQTTLSSFEEYKAYFKQYRAQVNEGNV